MKAKTKKASLAAQKAAHKKTIVAKSTRRTITRSELKRLSFCNSDKLPGVVNSEGQRYQWVGIGWVCEGELHGDEVQVID